MKFCDFVQFMHQNYEVKTNAGEFVAFLIDAILDDAALEKDSSNPIYELGKSTKEAYYSGRLPISQKKAAAITPRIDEAKFADFVSTYSFDALNHMKNKMAEFGFDVNPSEVGQACANILAQIIRRRAEGLSDDVTILNYQRMESGKKLKNIAPATIERRGDKLHISGEVITIHQALVPDDVDKHELDYIRALYEAYAQKLNRETFTADDIPSLPKRYVQNYKEQRMAYYSAVSIERSVRDIFVVDGLVTATDDDVGILYLISESGRKMSANLQSEYAIKYKELMRLIVERYRDYNDVQLLNEINRQAAKSLRR